MIASRRNRYLLAQVDEARLVRFDRLLKRKVEVELDKTSNIQFYEGTDGHFMLVGNQDGRLHASVSHVQSPTHFLAEATFDDGWVFRNARDAWAHVPEYLLVPSEESGPSLLRVADDAEVVSLEDFGTVTRVVAVPDSRLVVFAGGGYLTAFDPIAGRAGAHLKLAEGTNSPTLGFRKEGKELVINDGPNLIKVETAHWTAIDAAGSDDEDQSAIAGWSPVDADTVAVWREAMNDVLVIDVDSMLPVAIARFEAVPSNVFVLGKTVAATSPDGELMVERLRQIS
jgi:hypothetical protein